MSSLFHSYWECCLSSSWLICLCVTGALIHFAIAISLCVGRCLCALTGCPCCRINILSKKKPWLVRPHASWETPAITWQAAVWSQLFVVRVESCAQMKLLSAEVLLSGIDRWGCTCGTVLWALGLSGECVITGTKQASKLLCALCRWFQPWERCLSEYSSCPQKKAVLKAHYL